MSFNGQFSGMGASDFLLGDFSNYTQISGPEFQAASDAALRLCSGRHQAYASSDGECRPVRWDIVSGYHSEDGQLMTLQPGRQSTVFPLATPDLLFAGDQGYPPM